jgi:hypothetical protein
MSFNYIDLKPKYPPLNFAAATAVMLAALEASLEGGGGVEVEDTIWKLKTSKQPVYKCR